MDNVDRWTTVGDGNSQCKLRMQTRRRSTSGRPNDAGRQARDSAEMAFLNALDVIDRRLGKDTARNHPELVVAFMHLRGHGTRNAMRPKGG
jgi:hypothetical protein